MAKKDSKAEPEPPASGAASIISAISAIISAITQSRLLSGLLVLIVLTLIIIIIVAFIQGRSVSFWPPSIGALPTAMAPTVASTNASPETPVPPILTSTFTPSPIPTPECKFNDLFKCSNELVPITIAGGSRLTATAGVEILVIDFSNNQNASGLALQFRPALNVQDFAGLEISGMATQTCTFLIEYKIRSGAQLTVVATSPYRSFHAATSTTETIRIPLAFSGAIDEVAISFYNIGESSTVVIESMRLSP